MWDAGYMSKLKPVPQDPRPDPVALAAAAVHSLMQTWPAGTAFFIGIVLMVMRTGRLVQTQGRLARAALPCGLPRRWGWPRVERALERGQCSRDPVVERAEGGCGAPLPGAPGCLGEEPRAGGAMAASPSA